MSFISWLDIISVVVPEPKGPEVPDPKIYYEFIPESGAAAVNPMLSYGIGKNLSSMANLF